MQDKPGVLHEQLQELVDSMGYVLVDANSATVKGTLQIRVIIYSENGVGTVECEEVARALGPRLELLFDNRDVTLEVGSPGLERKFSSCLEFTIFTGKAVRVYTDDWIPGIINNFDGEKIELMQDNKKVHIDKRDVIKAQLVFQGVK